MSDMYTIKLDLDAADQLVLAYLRDLLTHTRNKKEEKKFPETVEENKLNEEAVKRVIRFLSPPGAAKYK